jgi:hypothetical protein
MPTFCGGTLLERSSLHQHFGCSTPGRHPPQYLVALGVGRARRMFPVTSGFPPTLTCCWEHCTIQIRDLLALCKRMANMAWTAWTPPKNPDSSKLNFSELVSIGYRDIVGMYISEPWKFC